MGRAWPRSGSVKLLNMRPMEKENYFVRFSIFLVYSGRSVGLSQIRRTANCNDYDDR